MEKNRNGLKDGSKVSVGKRLRQLREAREFSQTALAELAEVSRSSIVHYESAKAMPGGTELIKLATALDSTPNYILTGSDDFGGSDGDLGILTTSDQNLAMMRLSLLILSLNRQTREHLGALVVDMVRQSRTESEFAQLKAVLDAIESQVGGQLGEGIDALIDGMNMDSLTREIEAIADDAPND